MIDPKAYQYSHSPPWANHVTGYWNVETENGKTVLPIKFCVICAMCKAEFQGDCSTGNVKTRINKFAFFHNHKGLT